MPPVRVNVARTVLLVPRSTVTAPLARTDGTLKENALGEPMCGCPSRLNRMRNIALASVAVPTVERASPPIRSWSTMIAVVSPSSTSTSGRASVGMKPCTKALYVSLISRCDSAAIVPNTRELLPEPEMPVNTVSRRFGISTLTSLRLFTRAPCTRIRSWLSAACSAGGCVSVPVAMLIVSPSVRRRGRGNGPLSTLWAVSARLAQPSARRFLHERADPGLVGGGQLGQGEGDRPHGAFVEVRHVIEAERRVPRLELLRGLEEAEDLAVLGVRGHPVPGSWRERRRAGFDDGMEPLGQGAIRCRHLRDLREQLAFPVRLGRARAAARAFQLLGALLHRAPFLIGESLVRLALRGGALAGLLPVVHRRFLRYGS